MMKRFNISCFYLLIFTLFAGCDSPRLMPEVQKGVFDLSTYNFTKSGVTSLRGQWEFYWSKFYRWQDFKNKPLPEMGYIEVPKIWNAFEHKGVAVGGQGYATYRVRVKLPGRGLKLAIKMRSVGTAYKLFVNNQLLAQTGKTGTTKQEVKPFYNPLVIDFVNTNQEIDIILQVANFHHRNGGIWQEIQLGLETQIRHKREIVAISDFFLLGSIFIMALYHIGLFWARKKSISALYFSFVCLLSALRLTVTDEYLINYFAAPDWFMVTRLDYLSINLSSLAFFYFFSEIFPEEYSKKILRLQAIALGGLSVLVVFLAPVIFTQTLPLSQLFVLLSGVYVITMLIKALIRKKRGSLAFAVGFVVLFATVINDILYARGIIESDHQFGLGLFVFIFSQALVLSFRFSKAFIQTEELSKELNYTNKSLEQLVDVRTEELQQSNTMLNQFVEEMDQINSIVVKKNLDITDSIQYASSIQQAMLPSGKQITQVIPKNFIFYKPRDIVSGDFYWFAKIINEQTQELEKIIFAAVDCTGHGVPGAFMSMLGMENLNNIVNQQKIYEPQKILTRLDHNISKAFRQKSNNVQDGMDLALFTFDLISRNLSFAGAFNPLIVMQEGKMHILNANRDSIGGIKKNKVFDQKEIQLIETNMVYLFSDGVQDQFGGKRGRKFMKKRLYELFQQMHEQPMEVQHKILEKTMEDWMEEGREKQIDDMLVVGLRL